jgi:uncharacterized membrane protein (UPF0127 family)
MKFNKIQVADTFFKRFIGLMFRKDISPEEAVVFPNASAIHTFFMRFPIDIVFADKNRKIIKICENVRPWRVVACPNAYYAIECKGGQARVNPNFSLEKFAQRVGK